MKGQKIREMEHFRYSTCLKQPSILQIKKLKFIYLKLPSKFFPQRKQVKLEIWGCTKLLVQIRTQQINFSSIFLEKLANTISELQKLRLSFLPSPTFHFQQQCLNILNIHCLNNSLFIAETNPPLHKLNSTCVFVLVSHQSLPSGSKIKILFREINSSMTFNTISSFSAAQSQAWQLPSKPMEWLVTRLFARTDLPRGPSDPV